jgi:hypothetical protein
MRTTERRDTALADVSAHSGEHPGVLRIAGRGACSGVLQEQVLGGLLEGFRTRQAGHVEDQVRATTEMMILLLVIK